MSRLPIDFGIDLGTTNSAVACYDGNNITVYRNYENMEFTPSAVWIDKDGSVKVGKMAKERLEIDPENAHCEFKLQMGKKVDYTFLNSRRVMKPEDLSAEVLKALKTTVSRRTGDEIRAAVITIPAAFELPQCDATQRAAESAGLIESPLLQEPIAAALAYGFNEDKDDVFWLVFDLGGGTFDAAVIRSQDGEIHVVNHGGDNTLGGKKIDWAIVDEILIPHLTGRYPLKDFHRGNRNRAGAMAKLKMSAEQAKIELSDFTSTTVHNDFICNDDEGNPVRLECKLERADVEKLTKPILRHAIKISRRVLAEKRLDSSNIEKVLLVGGPTYMPIFREWIPDEKEGLGIPVDFNIDPLTVVAQGAALFARSKLYESVPGGPVEIGTFTLDLDYPTVGPDVELLVGGTVRSTEKQEYEGFAIQFTNERTHWQSGKIPLSLEGAFTAELVAEPGPDNPFRIELFNSTGSSCPTEPNRLSYKVGKVILDPPLTHAIGVAMADNKVDVFFHKGTPLPTSKRSRHRTVQFVRSGDEGDRIRIPIIEGENTMRADRNNLIGYLEIRGDQVRRDIPVGSEVDIMLKIDASRLVTAEAYIPMLDDKFAMTKQWADAPPVLETLRSEFESQKKRLTEARERTNQTNNDAARAKLWQIDREQMEYEIESSLRAAQADPDAADKAASRLMDLTVAIDEVEDALKPDAQTSEVEDTIKQTEQVVNRHGDETDKRRFQTLEQETRRAVEMGNPDLISQKIRELDMLRNHIIQEQPEFWVEYFRYLDQSGIRLEMTNPAEAERLFALGYKAIQNDDFMLLKDVVIRLVGLLPRQKAEEVSSRLGGTTQRA